MIWLTILALVLCLMLLAAGNRPVVGPRSRRRVSARRYR
jgi:hypothetical protein